MAIWELKFTAGIHKFYPITYNIGSGNYFETNRFNLGHYLRDNSQEIYLCLTLKPLRGLIIDLAYLNATHGNEYAYETGSNVDEHPVMENITWKNESFSISTNYEFLTETYLYIEYRNNNVSGFNVDNKTAQEYLNMYSPGFFQGKNNIISLGFNIGF